jgi:GDP-L-fucose synthase
MELKDKRILVTGASSFLGKSLVPLLKKENAELITFRSREYDLKKEHEVERLFNYSKPQIVIHLAADNGGIVYTRENPGSILYNNLLMNTLVQEYSRLNNVEKFVGIGSSTSYPKIINSPLKEDDLWIGYPEDVHASIGLSKKIMMLQSQTYQKQYQFNAIHLIPVNLYGPNYTMDSKTIRIIPLLIQKLVDGKRDNKDEIKLSGTKDAFREFLYVDDCSEAIIQATKLYDKPLPVNLGSGKDIKIYDLANKIKEIVGFKGEIIWEEKFSDEQPRKVFDVSRAKKEFGFTTKTSLEEGIKKTLDWYLKDYKDI